MDRHATRPGLDEPARDEEMLVVAWGAVAVVLWVALAVTLADFRVFLRDVQRIEEAAGGEDVEGLLVKDVERVHEAAVIHVAAEGVEAGEQRLAIGETVAGDAVEREIAGARAVRAEGCAGRPE